MILSQLYVGSNHPKKKTSETVANKGCFSLGIPDLKKGDRIIQTSGNGDWHPGWG